MVSNTTSSSNRRSGPLARPRAQGADAIDRMLAEIAALLDESAASIEATISNDGGAPSPLARSIAAKLRRGALSMNRYKGEELVDAAIATARRHPAWFVTGSATLAGLIALMVVAPRPHQAQDHGSAS